MIRKTIKEITALEKLIRKPKKGLPKDVFYFITRITPMINVDLLIKDKKRGTLLTWRDDNDFGPGWHIPGGIIRYKEKIFTRIKKTAKEELNVGVNFEEKPLSIEELISNHKSNRAHFISLLYKCTLKSSLDPDLEFQKDSPEAGRWSWHKRCPKNIIPVHKIYKQYIGEE